MKMIGCNHFICHLFTECPYIASYENDYIIWCISIFHNSGKLLLVPYTKDFGIITRF